MATPKQPRKQHTKKAQALAAAYQQVLDAQARLEELEGQLEPGRPTKFKPQFITRVTDLCLLGLGNEDIARHFEVDVQQIERWIRDVPEFRKAIWEGREGADAKVAAAMFKAAVGYEHPEDDIRTLSLGNNMGSEIAVTRTTKRYPPNIHAAQLLLANRQRSRWAMLGRDPSLGANPQEQAAAARAAIRAAMAEFDPSDQPQE
jgi:hypothetical protein